VLAGCLGAAERPASFPHHRDHRPRTSNTDVSGNHDSISPSTVSPSSRTAKTARAPSRRENSLSSTPYRSRTPEAWEPARKVAEEERRDSERDEPIASNLDHLPQGPAISRSYECFRALRALGQPTGSTRHSKTLLLRVCTVPLDDVYYVECISDEATASGGTLSRFDFDTEVALH
jgi:hypothetical protein